MELNVDRFPILFTDEYYDIVPVRAGYQHCVPGYRFGPQLRDSWTIQYVVSGCGTVIKDGKSFTVGAEECFVLRPGEEIELCADLCDPWFYIWVGFRANIPLPEILYNEDKFYAKQLDGLFHEIGNCNKRTNHPLEMLIVSYIWRLLFYINQMSPTSRGASKSKAEAYVEQARSIIHNANAVITVQEVADKLHLNRCHLSRIFRENAGSSIQSYINNEKLQIAGTLLHTYTASRVATMLNYSDVASFSRAFKNYYHLSPRQYLAQLKQGTGEQSNSVGGDEDKADNQ